MTRPLAEEAPGVWEVFTSDWSRCFITALADVVARRDVKSWTDLLTLPLAEVGSTWSGMRVRSGVAAWTGLVVFVLHCRSGRARTTAHQPRTTTLTSCPGDHSHPEGCSPSSLRGASSGSPSPQRRLSHLSASSTPVPLLMTVWPWTRFGGSRLLRLLQQTWTKFAILSSRSRRLLGRASPRFDLRTYVTRCALHPRTCSSGFFLR